ncbi:MAG: phosphatidate cytidylyltransferase [Clostridiales bacterium]|nr:phosphatidate cytidylyltransferase [Clostridiales bacterium]
MLTRTLVGIGIVALALAGLWLGGLWLVVVYTVFFVLAVQELGRAFSAKGKTGFWLPAYIFAALFPITYYFGGFNALYLFVFFLACFVATVVGQVLTAKGDFEAVPYSLLPFAYPLLPGVTLVLLYFGLPEDIFLTATALALFAPALGDTLAYFGGVLLGRHKLCPAISPKKTVEGALFGLLGGTLLGLLLWLAQPWWGGAVGFWPLLILGLVCGAMGQVGDLFASCLKRYAGVKDFSGIFPGHGGILDRIDSQLLCAPVVLAYFMLTAL